MSKLQIEKKGSVLHVKLNRPEVHNAFDPDIMTELTKTFKDLRKDQSVMAVRLSGNGPSFCAGGDLQWMKKSIGFTLAQNLKDAQKISNMYEAIFNCPVPILASLHGSVMGGGVGLAAVCDIVAAETSTKFSLSEVRLGLVPSVISTYVLRKVAETDARPLMLTAEVFNASHAHGIGLVHHVGDTASCEGFIQEKTKLIVNNGPEALRVTKDLIQKVKTMSPEGAKKLTLKTIAQRRVSKEGQEGLTAFFEKRSPTWRREE